ncbi:hypothetical protein GLOIN_2v1782088 [Rhizophagus irregularis DAOM 181602=DAOM 197198]|uniref:Uncharacterized protein n=1 Tax=Rhizophagus irregularis (strain DAOM 181602 / DAOM 197198 / MUCL 43194) TaxID=747089 RepID=U9TV13_RHIID|nr:hypothetical protein GLOIN_2v1782088 [Rhizophagus irregularis DAOM 181602=DAOM 197198]
MSMSDIESMSSDGSDSDLSTEEFLENIPDEKTIDCVKLVSSKVNKIEEIANNFKNLQKKHFLKYGLSSFTLENLQKLVAITTQFHNPNSSSESSK